MKLMIKDNKQEFDYAGAMEILNLIKEKPNAVIGLATGNTPKGMYDILGDLCKEKQVDFSRVTTLNLDEYLGIESSNSGSCKSYLNKRLYTKVNLKQENIHHLNSNPEDYEKECCRYNNLINDLGGIDLLILGIGHNGHLGFNEPNTPFDSMVHICNLTDKTRTANIWSFGSKDKVPKKGVSMGIKNIMNSKRLMLLANGDSKSQIIYKALKGKVTEEVPASVLQLHNDVVVVLDREAGKILLGI
ncbi:glucosamine-6-phosphate deaminase [Vallitalea longa]|uniref:Glucosamine-6-phosphate deaminase n=1 Tax=Vallitalea longa TaxID=2936439 RepID=A0A9W5Y8G7_9FIRM|nr:glucosamine-6-phosphate deaminase [Vallitalea longa]GKX27951.1 glucosamine-6-phosphate deaminase [Vallitalea longa]